MQNYIQEAILQLPEVQKGGQKILEVGAQPMIPEFPSTIMNILKVCPGNQGAGNDVLFYADNSIQPIHIVGKFHCSDVQEQICDVLDGKPDIIFGTQVFDRTLPDWMQLQGIDVDKDLDEKLVTSAHNMLSERGKLIILNYDAIPRHIDQTEGSNIDYSFYLDRRPKNIDQGFALHDQQRVYVSTGYQTIYTYQKIS